MTQEERELLERFVVDNEDLEKLESELAKFNIFEAIGVVRQELRHSNFLAFLLNPSQNHRLGDIFLKRLLKRVLLEADEVTDSNGLRVSAVDIDIADLEDAEVRREWKNIDILIHSPNNRLMCAIENKIDSVEHSDQLRRYREIVSQEFGDCRAILIYLSPEGDPPSDNRWTAYSYSKIAELIDTICENHQSTLGSDAYTLITHYSNLIRRHIVSDSEIAELCRKIYNKHKPALDLIFEHRPDLQSELAEFIKTLIHNNAELHKLVLDDSSKKHIRFADVELDKFPVQRSGHSWTSSQRVLLFEFVNEPNNLFLVLTVGPGNVESVRHSLHEMSLKNLPIFRKTKLKENRWAWIYKKEIIKLIDYEVTDSDELYKKVQAAFDNFISSDLPVIRELTTKVFEAELSPPLLPES
jgi:thiamine phosphate synthase YjbQ (UPF0047 family)